MTKKIDQVDCNSRLKISIECFSVDLLPYGWDGLRVSV